MLQEVLDVIPDSLHRMPMGVAMGIAAGGVVLALVGARLSRSILTLGLVAGGTILGLHLPKWLGWGIDPMGTAFGAAIVLGLAGFMLTTVCEGLLLGLILATFAGAAVWMSLAAGVHWDKPQIDWSATAVEIALKLWSSLPSEINRALPIATLIGLGIGWFLVMLWPKLGRLLLYSLAGIGLFVVCGSLGMQQSHPDWLQSITPDPWIQGACVAWMVLLSCLVQWLLLPRQKKKPAAQTSDKQTPAPSPSYSGERAGVRGDSSSRAIRANTASSPALGVEGKSPQSTVIPITPPKDQPPAVAAAPSAPAKRPLPTRPPGTSTTNQVKPVQ